MEMKKIERPIKTNRKEKTENNSKHSLSMGFRKGYQGDTM